MTHQPPESEEPDGSESLPARIIAETLSDRQHRLPRHYRPLQQCSCQRTAGRLRPTSKKRDWPEELRPRETDTLTEVWA